VKPLVLDGYYEYGRAARGRGYVPREVEAPAVVIRGGTHKAADVVAKYPEYARAEVRGFVYVPPVGGLVEVVESVCCVKPRAVGRDLVFASTQRLRLEIRMALVRVYYTPEGEAFRRRAEVRRRWNISVLLHPLTPALADFVASEKYLYNMYPIEPPDKLVVTLDDGAEAVVAFDDSGPRVERVSLPASPSILWFLKKPEDVVKELLLQEKV